MQSDGLLGTKRVHRSGSPLPKYGHCERERGRRTGQEGEEKTRRERNKRGGVQRSEVRMKNR